MPEGEARPRWGVALVQPEVEVSKLYIPSSGQAPSKGNHLLCVFDGLRCCFGSHSKLAEMSGDLKGKQSQ